jgi:2-polyprenyl-3-methyl-5-hydroxy-6-metoxy-1,4-benzoquinol methylase
MKRINHQSFTKTGIPSDVYDRKYFLYGSGGMQPLVRAVRTGDFKNVYRYNVYSSAIEMTEPKKTDRVMDIGCGRGELCVMLAKRGVSVLGIDYAKDSVALCEELRGMLPANQKKLINFQRGSLLDRNLKLKKNYYDFIYFLGVIEHMTVSEANRALEKIYSLLRKGGRVVIHTNNFYFEKLAHLGVAFVYHGFRVFTDFGSKSIEKTKNPYEHFHINYYSSDSLTKALRGSGFDTQVSFVRPKNVKEVKNLISPGNSILRRPVPYIIYWLARTPTVGFLSPSIWAIGTKI